MSRRVLQLSFLAAIVAAIWIGKPYFDKWQADRARIGEERNHQIAEERRQASLAIVLPPSRRLQKPRRVRGAERFRKVNNEQSTTLVGR